MTTVSVILACGGSSSRMGFDKLFYDLSGEPVFIHAMRIYDREFDEVEISEIVLAVPKDAISAYEEAVKLAEIKKPVKIVSGGASRTESIINAFRVCDKNTRYIAVADGARPFTDPETVRNCVKNAAVFGASVLGVPVKDTVKIVDDDFIVDTPDRRRLYIVGTPQVFRRDLFVRGVQFALDHDLQFTDDAAMVEAVGVKVHITQSDYRNIKITTKEDLVFAEAML
jgi:2-C-methyl-D-erythritol 4-phosphate cytidylyltransferase